MAIRRFKTPGRQRRVLQTEGSFSKGMQYTESFLDENTVKLLVNYRIMNSGDYLLPRKGVYGIDNKVRTIATTTDAKFPAPHAVYYGTYYSQLGEDVHGRIVVSFGIPTSAAYDYYYTDTDEDSNYFQQSIGGGLGFVALFDENGVFTPVNAAGCNFNVKCNFYKHEPKPIFAVHDSELYFINNGRLSKLLVEWSDDTNEYVARIQVIEGKDVNLTEATTVGFNMFSENPYLFSNTETPLVLAVKGILPYAQDENTLKLSANLGETLVFKLYYDYLTGVTYKAKWEMAYFGSNQWTVLQDYTADPGVSEGADIKISIKPEYSKFTLRCTVAPVDSGTGEVDELIAKVGIYPVYEMGLTDLIAITAQDNFDLGTAKGIASHGGMMALWGVRGAERTVFLSDGPDATYFPFPHNIFSVPDEILKVVSFSGSLLIFTARKLYYVEGNQLEEMWGPYTLLDNVDFTAEDMECVLGVNSGLLVRLNGQIQVLARNQYTGKIGDTRLVNLSVPVNDILFDFRKFIKLLSDRLYKFDVSWGETTKVVEYDFVNWVDSGDVKNMFRYVVYEDGDDFVRYQIDVVMVYNSYSGQWTIETLSLPYNGAVNSGSSLYTSYVKVGAEDTEIYLQQLETSSTDPTDTYNTMFYGDAYNDHANSDREAYINALPSEGEDSVSYVVDGDTLYLDVLGKVRLHYINTPESTTSVEPYGVEASNYLKSLLTEGTPVYYEFDSIGDRLDRYDRALVWLRLTDASGDLVQVLVAQQGYVKSYYDFGASKYTTDVEAAVNQAVADKIGLYTNLYPNGPFYVRTPESATLLGNFQILDTGNRNQDPFMEKRYKEIQFFMSNDSPNVLDFFLEFYVDSIRRNSYTSWTIDQITDPESSDYGTIYVTEVEDPSFTLGNETALSYWQLDFSVFPDLEVVKVVYRLSGRGHYPRVVLVSRNQSSYKILDYAWVFRTMNGR